ncbi:MAG: DUF4430 domain-containing protein [Clostridiales bacterium]|nr:DUF4430 domain-containing protein [Clostridiales bacterium]
MKKKNLLSLISIIVVVAIIAGLGAVWYFTKDDETSKGSKTVIIKVVDDNKEITVYTVYTDSEYLKEVMEEATGLTFSGTEGDYGLMISEINGLIADYATNGAYWSFYINDTYCEKGIETQPAADGDIFKIEYTLAE